MAGQATIGVSLQFNADVNAAKQNIQSLSQSLLNLSKSTNLDTVGGKLNSSFLEAKKSAGELFTILQKSTNLSTGNLDLRSFSAGLQNSGKNLETYQKQLAMLGPEGTKAFNQIADAVISAEIPLTKANTLVSGLWDSLKRTAKWQLSSSIIHGFMGAIQKAYGYAQDLNESLNNIRIVTGYNTDKMADFAKEANVAAKALSATTTAYTDASLIYFQQGLNDAQVKERADVTVKMANVTRQSAETVSDQMTAVWNNFAKGGKDLESYADKMVALGAATASSSDEIATGLEKFAAVADTVGLSFDYAAAALATVTAETRQSADTVGTAFKTLFARLESLSLGDTLEDGTDLTKYSKALQAVGISIKDASGELKDMDNILDELGAKWQSLTKDQQVALAQTVAGQRQYTQLVALMSNWDKFQENLSTTRNSEGALQEQADIYAESWEAAQDRVQAALEEIYTKIIDDESFIKLLNGIEKTINGISRLIDIAGGLKGILGIVGDLILQVFSNEISNSINNFINRLKDFSGATAQSMQKQKEEALRLKEINSAVGTDGVTTTEKYNLAFQKEALLLADKMNEYDRERVRSQAEYGKTIASIVAKLEEEKTTAEENLSVVRQTKEAYEELKQQQQLLSAQGNGFLTGNSGTTASVETIAKEWGINDTAQDWAAVAQLYRSETELPPQLANFGTQLDEQLAAFNNLTSLSDTQDVSAELEIVKTKIQEILVAIGQASKTSIQDPQKLAEAEKKLSNVGQAIGVIKTQSEVVGKKDLINTKNLKEAKGRIEDAVDALRKTEGPSENIERIQTLLNEIDGDNLDMNDEEGSLEKYKNTLEEILKLLEQEAAESTDVMSDQGQADRAAQIKALAESIGIHTEQISLNNEHIKQSNEEMLKSIQGAYQGLGEAVTAISQYGMALTSLTAQFETLFTSIGNGKPEITDITSILTTLGAIVRVVTLAIKADNVIMALSTKLKQENNVESIKNIGIRTSEKGILGGLIVLKTGENAGIRVNTELIRANAAALSAHPVGAILSVLALVIAAIAGVTAKIKENNEALVQSTEESKEKAKELKDELSSLKEQKQAYDDIYNKFKKGKVTKDEYISTTAKLAEALGIENAAILLEQERYTELNGKLDEAIKKKRILAGETAKEELETNVKNAKQNVHNTLDATATYDENNNLIVSGSSYAMGESGSFDNFFKNKNLKFLSKEQYESSNDIISTNSINVSNPEEIEQAIKEINSLIDYAEQNNGYESQINALKDIVEKLQKQKENYLDPQLSYVETFLDSLDAKGNIEIDPNELTIENYPEVIDNIVKLLQEKKLGVANEILEEVASSYVKEQDKDLGKKIDLFDQLFNLSDGSENAEKSIRNFIKGLEDDTIINFYLALSDEEKAKLANDIEGFTKSHQNQIITFTVETKFNNAIQGQKQLNKLEIGKTYQTSEIESIVKTLDEAGISAEQYFMKMADGSYLVTDSLISLQYQFEQVKASAYVDTLSAYSTEYKELNDQLQQVDKWIESSSPNLNEIAEKTGRSYDELKTALEDGSLIEDLEAMKGDITSQILEIDESIQNLNTSIRDSITSFEQLQQYKGTGLLSDEDYSVAYDRLRSSFLASSVDQDELASYTSNLLKMDEALSESERLFNGNVAAAEAYARSVLRMNKGVEVLAKNIDDWYGILTKTSDHMSSEYIGAVNDATNALADLLDVIPYDIPSGFVQEAENIELLKKAATGSEEAIDELRAKLSEALVERIIVDNELDYKKDEILAAHTNLQTLLKDITVGTRLDTEEFITAAQHLVDVAGMTADQAQAYFDSIGYQVEMDEVVDESKDITEKTSQVPVITTKKLTLSGTGFIGKLLQGSLEIPEVSYQDGDTNVTEDTKTTTGVSIGQAGKVKKPIIKSLTKKATGVNNNYSSKNAGGKSPTGKSSGSGGSGGGGGGKEITPKNANDEIERYHEIDKLISSLSKKLNELSTLKDRAWGGRHISAIRAERAALEEYGGLLDQKLAEAEAYLQSDASKINAYGAQYDAQGHITNFNQIISNAVEAYNSGAMSDEEYSDLKKKLANYEDSLEKREDLLYEKAENARKILDSKFEEVEYTVEINIEIDDRNIEYIEWLVKHLEDKAFSQAEVIDTATRNYNTMLKKWDDYAKGIHDILQTAGASEGDIANYLNGNVKAIEELDDLTADAVEHLGDYTDGLRETYDQLIELKKLVEEQLEKIWDEWNDKIEHQIDLMKHQDDILTHYQNIIDVIGQAPLGLTSANMINLAKSQVEASLNITKALKSNLEANKAELESARASLAKVSADEDVKYWEEEIQRLEKVVADGEEEFYSSWEETVKRAADLYDITLQQSIKDFEASISDSFKTFDEALELLDQKKTLASQYIPEYKKLYELGKLNRDLAKELDKTNNLSAQKKLKDLQDEINDKMREGVQLSEYDLEYLQKKYDLRLAEIALEDAQAAKSTVRLRRDANGNYGYVYTADESQINDAVQDYEDKLYNIQELTENYLDDLSEAYIQTMAEMTNAIAEIRREDYASEEEYEAKIDQVKTYYTTRLQYYTDEINKALNNNQQLYLEDKNYIDKIFTDKESRQRAFTTDFKQTLVGGILTGYNNIQDATDTLVKKLGNSEDSESLIGQLCDNYKNWHAVTDKVLGENKTSFETFQTDLEEIINNPETGINAKIKGMEKTVSEMAKQSSQDYDTVAGKIADFQRETSPRLQQLKAETEAYTEAHLKLLEALATHYEDPHNVTTNTVINETIERTIYESSGDSGSSGGSSGGGGGNTTKSSPGSSSPTYWTYKIYVDGAEKYSGTGTTQAGVESTASSVANSNNLRLFNHNVNNSKKLVTYNATKKQQNGGNSGLHQRTAQTRFTGGYTPHWNGPTDRSPLPGRIVSGATGMYIPDTRYTGDWGADGRLAILHEKELVLNKTDTKNMLSAVETVRQVSKTIDLQASAERGNLINRTKNINTSLINSATNGTIEQAITIQADFPAATDRNEIAEAFNQLMQQSLQYAYRYNE